MNQLSPTFFANLEYHLDERLYEHARRYLRKLPGFGKQDAAPLYFMGVIDLRQENIKEARRVFVDLSQHEFFGLPALAGQICAESKSEDTKNVETLHAKLTAGADRMPFEVVFVVAWTFYEGQLFTNAMDTVRHTIDSGNADARIRTLFALAEYRLNGTWSDQGMVHLQHAKKSKDVIAMLVLVQVYLQRKELDECRLLLKELQTTSDRTAPVMAAQLDVLMAESNWDAVESTVEKALGFDPNFLLLYFYQAVGRICTKRPSAWKDFEGAALNALDLMEKLEPKNPHLWAKYSYMISQLSSGRPAVMEKLQILLERASAAQPDNLDCTQAYAQQLCRSGKYRNALSLWEKCALRFGDSSAICRGKISCLIELGAFDAAETEFDYLQKLPSAETEPWSVPEELIRIYLRLKLDTSITRQISGPARKAAVELHLDAARLVSGTGEYLAKFLVNYSESPYVVQRMQKVLFQLKLPSLAKFRQLDILFLVSAIDGVLQLYPFEPQKTMYGSPKLDNCIKYLEDLHAVVPGASEVAYVLARTFYLKGDFEKSSNMLDQQLESENLGEHSSLLLLSAEVAIAQKAFAKCRVHLDRAIANDFQVKESFYYTLLHSRYLRLIGDEAAAINCLSDRLNIKTGTSASSESVQAYCRIHLELIDLYTTTKDYKKAENALKQTQELFRGSIVEPAVILSAAALLSAMNPASVEIVQLLSSVDSGTDAYFYLAQEELGRFYLGNQKINDYRQLFEGLYTSLKATPSAAVMLGEAYMRIPDSKKAIAVLQKATREQPQNEMLEGTMGSFYIRCHMYKNALNYYEALVKRGNKSLRPEYAHLLINLGRHERAEQLLIDITAEKSDVLADNLLVSRCHKLLASLYAASGKHSEELTALHNAKKAFEKDLIKARRDSPDLSMKIAEELAEVLLRLAENSFQKRNFIEAIQLLHQAYDVTKHTRFQSVTEKLITAHLAFGDTSESYRLTKELQKLEPDNKAAKLFIAQISFRRKDFDHALDTFKEYFKLYPNDFIALAESTPYLVRMGQIKALEKLLKEMEPNADDGAAKIQQDLCNGLFQRYSGNIMLAVELIAPALTTSVLVLQAAFALIEMVCNWDTEIMGSQYLPCTANVAGVDGICQKIFQKMTAVDKGVPRRMEFLRALSCVCSGENAKLKELQQTLETQSSELLEPSKGFILATVLLKLGDKTRAAEVLQAFDKHIWTIEDCDILERLWLLSAELHSQSNKPDDSAQLIFKATEFNRSGYLVNMHDGIYCVKQNPAKAAEAFRKAFESTANRDFLSGERCAWAMIKCGRPLEAVSILDYFRQPTAEVVKADREIDAEKWKTIAGLRQQALNALAYKTDDDREGTKTRSRKISNVA